MSQEKLFPKPTNLLRWFNCLGMVRHGLQDMAGEDLGIYTFADAFKGSVITSMLLVQYFILKTSPQAQGPYSSRSKSDRLAMRQFDQPKNTSCFPFEVIPCLLSPILAAANLNMDFEKFCQRFYQID